MVRAVRIAFRSTGCRTMLKRVCRSWRTSNPWPYRANSMKSTSQWPGVTRSSTSAGRSVEYHLDLLSEHGAAEILNPDAGGDDRAEAAGRRIDAGLIVGDAEFDDIVGNLREGACAGRRRACEQCAGDQRGGHKTFLIPHAVPLVVFSPDYPTRRRRQDSLGAR